MPEGAPGNGGNRGSAPSGHGEVPATHTEAEGATLDMPEGVSGFSPGQVLGERYRILAMLGRGGMGEVWHAFDLKLRVDVGLKALRGDLFKSERRLELLRQEVRAAREVVSPNVCRIFDLIEIECRELVSMEYVDGATLLAVLQERGPLELKEAQDIASQFLAGLEAIHKAGLIHRDVKPENIMLTRAGRVVVMDFGLARQEAEGGGSVSGTPAYMAPEQVAGQTLDARADVYAAGVVLAEMVSPEGIKSFESRQSVWEGVRSEPASLPDSPWTPVLKKAVAKDRERRYNSAHTLTRALEDVTLRVEGAEDLHPYPGLESFTEENAEYFFGREAEVEQMWRKLGNAPRMFALVGPSGAGKSSFLRAGLIPAKTAEWATVVCTPGSSPVKALANAFIDQFSRDTEAIRRMLDFGEPDVAVDIVGRWRAPHERALLIVDQFEELFTLNAADDQRRFADLLSRFVLEADVHVLLSVRDDFFFHSHQHRSLDPLQDGMTLIGPPEGAALRRALVNPATKCGYRFEDDELVEEMLAEVEGERGALPMLAFAAARLWEKRDREYGLLTRRAYHDIGGVGGALARHAEATIDRIGSDRIAVVRELFRNLVTAEGTRAVREWDELLSVFDDRDTGGAGGVGPGFIPGREAAQEVLSELIDARLLTSYEVREEDREPTHRIEIIHESLLANWPRLVRWQTQDADAVQLRDQLRRAAQTWDERGRPVDLLWAGSAFREYGVWRDRYPGGLSDLEEAFAGAMTRLAARTRRRRRMRVTAAFVVVLVVAAALGTLWRRSIHEARRAEAQKLVALGRLALEAAPADALALARGSLGVSDTAEARRLALEALWRRGGARVLAAEGFEFGGTPEISPDGQWLAASSLTGRVFLHHQGGGDPFELDLGDEGLGEDLHFRHWLATFGPSSSTVAFWPQAGGTLRLMSLPDWGTVCSGEVGPGSWGFLSETSIITATRDPNDRRARTLVSFPIDGGSPKTLGTVWSFRAFDLDPERGRLVFARGKSLILSDLQDLQGGSERVLGSHGEDIDFALIARATGDRVVTSDESGTIHVWSAAGALERTFTFPGEWRAVTLGRWGRRFALSTALGPVYVWDLEGPPGALPSRFTPRPDVEPAGDVVLDPEGRWAVVMRQPAMGFWPLAWPRYRVIRNEWEPPFSAVFTPDGTRLVLRGMRQLVVVPLAPGTESPSAIQAGGSGFYAEVHPSGRSLATLVSHSVVTVPLDGCELGDPLEVVPSSGARRATAAFDPTGRLLATATVQVVDSPEPILLQVLDLETGARTDLPVAPAVDGDTTDDLDLGVVNLRFAADGTLYTAGPSGVRRWNLAAGTSELLHPCDRWCWIFLDDDGRVGLVATHDQPWESASELFTIDLESRATSTITSHGDRFRPFAVALDPDGRAIITGGPDGVVRVGPIDGGEPHLLLGHPDPVTAVAVSPDGRWIASVSGSEIRLWAMPDVSRPPLHTLPRAELLAKLDSITNVRAVRDPESATGWKVEVGPFPGWAEVPTW